ncbi:unnamed protein product [Eruca vesicaria subsp. sativa]|uniref:Secreted protein n=1 Tax=Eruca vesicaria subsp. sativa TaxID=29727 RepID=A0ABC8J5S3_ERUVS|nr:unnamed protein product [Eruca vesicaria subsp. sativa]
MKLVMGAWLVGENVQAHGSFCLSCGGLSSLTVTNHLPTGNNFTGRSICKTDVAMRPTFSGRISSIHVSDKILRYIFHEEHTDGQNCVCTELSFHFQTFGPYLRWLRLYRNLCDYIRDRSSSASYVSDFL